MEAAKDKTAELEGMIELLAQQVRERLDVHEQGLATVDAAVGVLHEHAAGLRAIIDQRTAAHEELKERHEKLRDLTASLGRAILLMQKVLVANGLMPEPTEVIIQ